MVLAGQVALITGASSGIGSGIAAGMAEEGAKVAVNYCHNRAGAEAVVEAISKKGQEAFVVGADVTHGDQVAAMVGKVRERWGRIDILVNNAGDALGRRTLQDMTEEFWDQVMDLNLKSVFLCVKAVWEEMATRGSGSIINISSVAARNGGSVGAAAYSVAKGGLITYTKSLARELAPRGVRVNGIAPGVIDTPLHKRLTPSELYQKFVEAVPLGRAGMPSDIGDVAVFLASPAARYITGETLDVNGGLYMS